MESIIVFSHLRWDFVYQRPQHLLSRLARHYRILFFEEPEYHAGTAVLQRSSPLPNLTVCRPRTPLPQAGFDDAQMPVLREMVAQLGEGHARMLAWLYTPMALPLLAALPAMPVIYDCMDELSAFRNCPAGLVQREAELLRIADLVFTGGPSLYRAKQQRNPHVHCFTSSVDVAHFRQALDVTNISAAQRHIARPRLGFFGVIDERFEPALIEALADAHAEWQIILVGPVVKIDPLSLPRRPNIHYLGQQPYADLPKLLAGWDVCLMPFALNAATRFISPTKSLEYMAAEKPIVSTPIRDVVDLHGDVVEIAASPAAFVRACEQVLQWPDPVRQARSRLMREKLSHTSWEVTAGKINVLLRGLFDDSQHATPARRRLPMA